MFVGHEAVDQLGDHGRAPQTAADPDFPADLALAIGRGLEANVVEADGRAVVPRAGDGDLELARQIREFRMQARPLPQDFGDGTRIDDLVGRRARELVGGDVADAVPEVWMACISTLASSPRMTGMSLSLGQLNWMFCRVVKCP